MAPVIQQRVSDAQKKVQSAQKEVDSAKQKVGAEPEVEALARSEAKVHVETEALAEAKADAEAMVSINTSLHNLATDCLRLSMHFFYPIQQCAQQVYHSALPLSPTSSHLQKTCLQITRDKQLSHVTAFSGVPDTWGLLLRTINIRPRQVTSIATSAQRIMAACEDIVNIYDAITFVLQQTLCAPETVTEIQGSSDGSILFFAHSSSVTMWDVQTGGLIHTFTTQAKINNFAVFTKGNHIACGLSDGSVTFWDIHTKEKGEGFGNDQPVEAIYWLSPQELIVATQRSVYVYNIAIGGIQGHLPTSHPVWGLVCLGGHKFLVGTSQQQHGEADHVLCTLSYMKFAQGRLYEWPVFPGKKSPTPMPPRRLTHPIYVGNKTACITLPSGVQLFDTSTHDWTKNLPLLNAATSLAVSLNRNLVVQTKDSVQIFSLDVLKTNKVHNNIPLSHIYSLGEKHIVCLQPDGHLTLLNLETLQELHPNDNTSPLEPLLKNQFPSPCTLVGHGPVVELGVLAVVQAWRTGVPLPNWTEVADKGNSLSGLSPSHTRVITVYNSPQLELLVKDMGGSVTLAKALLEHENVGVGEVYDLTFDSETRFNLKAEGLGGHVKIPCDIIASPSGGYSHTIMQGEPEPLSEPWAKQPFTLDANCEWVIDTGSRKICWISPGNLQRGNGGHFWVGLSLVMLGEDGIVRKLTMKEPE